MMRVLVTNDDGIHAPGLAALEEIALQITEDVWVCAPSENQTGASHSLTLSMPVRLRKHGERRFSVTGTPTDAVSLALKKVIKSPPDLILSGINAGANLGDDVSYSGTVSAAMEGALAGIKSIALSQFMRPERPKWGDRYSAARSWGPKIVDSLITTQFASRTLINVNFPCLDAKSVKGIRVTRQGLHNYNRSKVHQAHDPHGKPYYWFGLDPISKAPDHGTDIEAIMESYVAITPLQLDLTHYDSMQGLAQLLQDL